MPLLSGEAFPGKGFRQGQQLLLSETIHRPGMSRSMYARIDALAPRVRLAIEIVEVGKPDPRP